MPTSFKTPCNILLYFRICQRYEEFNKKALTVPQDSQEIMELISYMESARNQLIRELYVDVEDSMKRLRFLLDMYLFAAEEIELNQNTLMWPKRLDPIFEANEKVRDLFVPWVGWQPCCHHCHQIVESAKTHGESALTEKQEKVNIEIEKCYQRAEKFSEYNDLTQMLQYNKDVARCVCAYVCVCGNLRPNVSFWYGVYLGVCTME